LPRSLAMLLYTQLSLSLLVELPLLLQFIGTTYGSGSPFFCSVSNPDCLNSFFNDSSILNTFLGDHDTVVFQNDVLKNESDCAAMTVLFARGTAEPGMCF
jgi:hypothetical protein